MTVHDLPAVNATLNAASGVLLVIGYFLIRSGRIDQHRRVMIAAFALSTLFLACYIVYHWQVGSVRFTRSGFVRPLYFSILFTHVVLAAHGYPDAPRKGDLITGLPEAGEDYRVFHAGTALENDRVEVSGGRVLCVTALGHNVKTAQRRAYEIVNRIRFDGMQYRRDIGHRALDARHAPAPKKDAR